jgi:uncharacterized integral membrane protein (TIGR00697 family)
MNLEAILISIIFVMFNYLMIILAYRFFGRVGLFACIPVTIILANIQVVIMVDLGGWAVTLGNAAYVSSYLITDLLGELYSKKEAQKAVFLGFFSIASVLILMQFIFMVTPSVDSVAMYDSVAMIFDVLPRIAIASLIAFLVSQSIDVVTYHFFKNKQANGKKLWLRNNVSTVTSQVVDGLVFTFLAFGTGPEALPFEVLMQIFITTYIIKALIALLDTPFMYLGTWMKRTNKVTEV